MYGPVKVSGVALSSVTGCRVLLNKSGGTVLCFKVVHSVHFCVIVHRLFHQPKHVGGAPLMLYELRLYI